MNGKEKLMNGYDVAAAVDAGFILLTKDLGEGWVKRINLDELDVSSQLSCPLGQLYGSYETGHHHLAELTGITETGDAREIFGTDHGFVTPNGIPYQYDELDDQWTRRITQAREEL